MHTFSQTLQCTKTNMHLRVLKLYVLMVMVSTDYNKIYRQLKLSLHDLSINVTITNLQDSKVTFSWYKYSLQ